MITNWAEWLGHTALSYYIQRNAVAFPILEVLHVIAITLVVGSIFVVDLRLLNLCSKSYRITHLLRAVLPLTLCAFVFALLTGFLLFSSQPVRYLHTPFPIKMGLLMLAGVNMAVFHLWTERRIAAWDKGGVTPLGARIAGGVSMVLWIAILVAGRFIGFVLESSAS
jgi:hypothetical protein